MLTGVKILVGVSPVLPSINESKLRITLVGVSILTPSIDLNMFDLRLSVAGRLGFPPMMEVVAVVVL